jgi:hypothetical protein
MKFLIRLFPLLIWLIGVSNSGLFAQAITMPIQSVPEMSLDTLNSQIFDTEDDFSVFIVEYLDLPMTNSDSSISRQILKDSLHMVLNRDKKITIPKAYLNEFSDFIIADPVAMKIMAQTVDLGSKVNLAKFTFEVKEGDHFFLKFDVKKGGIAGMQIEVLLNDVRIADDLSIHRKKEFTKNFVVSKIGKVDVVLRYFGFLKLQGDIEVDIVPIKQKIRLQQARLNRVVQEELNVLVRDTIYKTLFDEPVLVSHSLNLKGNSVFERQLELSQDQQVLGFAVFLFPTDQKEKLEFQRRDVYREDILQDFALKELIGRSYVYLPEFTFSELNFSVFDFNQKNYWLNGQNQFVDSWNLSKNSKRNYAFFGVKDDMKDQRIHIKLINKSALYDQEISLKVIALFVESFNVIESVEVQEFDEIIILSLL